MISKIYTSTLQGIEGHLTMVEADITRGIPLVHMVGLTDTIIKESVERIRASIINSGLSFPQCRITVNLSPADKRKNGGHYDLPIAIAILVASEQIKIQKTREYAFFGQLSLDGDIRSVSGILPLIKSAEDNNIKNIIIPFENSYEGSFLKRSNVYPVKNLTEAIKVIQGKGEIINYQEVVKVDHIDEDFSQVYGQENVKRAMIIAAAGGHNLMMFGRPGTGKTMMAKRFCGILPSLTYEERLVLTKIYSICGNFNNQNKIIESRPFRKPYSNITESGLFGGGVIPKPGEITLAHKGVLFLDEFTNFSSKIIAGLRKPMDDGEITIVRKREMTVFPCEFTLLIASNPCKCGYYGSDDKMCSCTPAQINAFKDKLYTPLMDRIDMFVQMNKVNYEDIDKKQCGMTTLEMKEMVNIARQIQIDRYKNENITTNSQLNHKQLEKYCCLGNEERDLLNMAYEKMNLSVRAYRKIMMLSRTIADLDNSEKIMIHHIAEALQYRDMRGELGGNNTRNV